ncbi:YCII-related domain-containing protein [Hirsutella rhossiliensis]|uniref:YCII-related domain-containing protein n=1 Tax=Hirsutella rhossiliensis TaxID=111463 RepID=A0A9P8MPY8_9HYPO|nr:YCII-related domain-containing protein [Hirsutella rhossiliensis]KAH0959155.1 YCII-related domain-containing protein [Hirsutella rhossiliensis]
MPRFMFLIKADAMAEAVQAHIPVDVFQTMTKFNEDMAAQGILLAAEGFRPTAVDGYRVKFSSSTPPEVVDGPFDVTKEDHVCGFWLVQTKDAQEALAWAKKVPFPQGELVVRRIGDCDDLGGSFTQELRSREKTLRAKLEENRKAAGM